MKRRDFFATAGVAATAATLYSPQAIATPTGSPIGDQHVGDQPKAQTIHQKVLAERKGSLKGMPEPVKLPKLTSKGLEAYVPDQDMPWDIQRAGYLLRRTMFGAKIADINMAIQKTPGEMVDMLLSDDPAPSLPASWINTNYTRPQSGVRDRDRFNEMIQWWLGLMVGQNISIREKMTFFWHDHWATVRGNVRQPQFNYWFIDLMRNNSLGNFKQMVKEVTVAPCMLVFLDGWYNTKTRPNENYGRELMELHTLGEGIGYTEEDIVEASRALTGWTLQNYGGGGQDYEWDPKDAIFIPARFDDTDKTFMGQTGNWGADDIVDIIFSERSLESAAFICRKLYREFVYELADEDIITQLAQILITNNWEIKPVMDVLLKSAHFFDSINFGAHITTPLEHFVGAIRSTDIQDANFAYVHLACSTMGCELLSPPNVKGWPAYRTWISASRLASRWAYGDEIVKGSMSTNPKFSMDVIAYASQFDGWIDEGEILVKNIIDHMIELEISESQFDLIISRSLGSSVYEWFSIPDISRKLKLEDLLKEILRLGEYQVI